MLSVEHVSKAFAGVQALDNVSVEIGVNEVVGLVGENGAGKSTLMRILAGVYSPDHGSLKLDGAPVFLRSPREANLNGIGIVFQEQSLLLNLTVGENIYLGQEAEFTRLGLVNRRRLNAAARRQLDKVLELSDRIYVMKDGRVVGNMQTGSTTVPQLHQMMVGRDRHAEYYRESRQRPARPEIVMEGRGLSVKGAYRDVDFALHQGEVLGIAGVVGSGREELTRTLFGFAPQTSGTLQIDGHEVRLTVPSQAADQGVGYIPRERRTEGLVLSLPIEVNMTLSRLPVSRITGAISLTRERQLAKNWVDKLHIRTPTVEALCLNLSGGNQQKVVLAKWMNARAHILIFDHPTRGLDVGAKEEVYELIRDLSEEGVAIVLTADTLEETIGLCHSILVMRDGQVTARFHATPQKPSQVDLIRHMV